MSPSDILEIAAKALIAFQNNEKQLFEVDANERSLTHKLAEILQRHFPKWDVDCEYNRLDAGIKVLPTPERTSSDDTDGISIFPDIIVHKRRDRNNLLVVEVKKATNRRTETDEQKLKGLTQSNGSYGYELGLHVIVDCKKARVCDIRAYAKGAQSEELTSTAAKTLQI